jgi:hypothetical protein
VKVKKIITDYCKRVFLIFVHNRKKKKLRRQ